ncbi:MAG: nucleotidyltransferase domain-containing protein [Defluviitaleaceae bacterium]|nr:nucleotidyltransferase domain-containing protein [Defluviitaleaceae bacterium]
MTTIEEIKEKIIPIAKEYGITKVALFGSFARGKATENSDIDILINESEKIRGMFTFGDFIVKLENTLSKKVDVITYSDLKNSRIRKYIEKDEVIIYGF